jgi:hypothetical protein
LFVAPDHASAISFSVCYSYDDETVKSLLKEAPILFPAREGDRLTVSASDADTSENKMLRFCKHFVVSLEA